MSREDVSKAFQTGLDILLQAKADPSHPGYEDLLLQATQYLERASDLLEQGDPEYKLIALACGSAHAECLLLMDYSNGIDLYFSSSPLLEILTKSDAEDPEAHSNGLNAGEGVLDHFWDQLDQIRDQYLLTTRRELVSSRNWANQIASFDRAILLSSDNAHLELIWLTCRATSLYLRIEKYNPGEIALCIVSMRRTIQLDETIGSTPSSDMNTFILQMLPNLAFEIFVFKKRLAWLESLAAAYTKWHAGAFRRCMDRHKYTPNLVDLDSAIAESSEALSWSRGTDILPIFRFELLLDYSQALHERYWMDGPMECLEDSSDALREALACKTVPKDRIYFCRQFLSTVTSELAKELIEDPDPNIWLKSLSLWQESVGLTEENLTELLATRLFELGKAAFKVYDRSDHGNLAHVSEASDCLDRAARITTDRSLKSEILFTRARVLYSQFTREGTRKHFFESLDSGNKAYQIICQTPVLAQQSLHQAGIYSQGFRMLRIVQENIQGDSQANIDQLQEAINLFKFLASFPHTNRYRTLDHLGRAHMLLYRIKIHTGQSSVQCVPLLEQALEYHKEALKQSTLDDGRNIYPNAQHPHHTFLGTVHHELSRSTALSSALRAENLESAIEYFRKTKQNTQNLSGYKSLASALEDRYKLTGQAQDLEECVSLLKTQSTPIGPLIGHPKQFFHSATQLVRICHEHSLHSQLVPVYRIVFKSLRRLSHMGLTSMARQKALAENSVGHACNAAAAALINNDQVAAVELLEEGRSLFFSQLLPMQTNTRRIHVLDPNLASDLEYTLEKLQECSIATDSREYEASYYHSEGGSAEEIDGEAMDITPQSRELRRYARLLEQYVDDVRKLPGYGDFMQPKTYSRLSDAAKNCPVVYVNISQYRCDAIIVNATEHLACPKVVSLPTSYAKLHNLSQTMQSIVRLQGREVRDGVAEPVRHFVRAGQTRQSPAVVVRDVLKQLWETVVHPVLLSLNFMNGPSLKPEKLPHICWCPTGPLATSLPLHAAGDYELGPKHLAITHVISSYTPTLSSLLQAFERKPNTNLQAACLLLISQPASPPSKPLPCVNIERDEIIAAVRKTKDERETKVTILHDSAGCVADTKSLLPAHELLHLACHGKQDREDPLESAILLHDGQMTLREIIKTPLPSAELAYLSACQTATGDIHSPDESLSLAGGFLFSGYRSVVATMWSINDRDGADVAKAFYKHLMEQDGAPATNSALALHCAVEDLRTANPNIEPIRWIPFMHMGITGGTK